MTIPGAAAGGAGFSLVEVLVVIAVLGMAMGLLATKGPTRSRTVEMQAAVEQVARAARLARSRAIAGNHAVRLVLDVPAHLLRIDDAPPTALPASMGLAMTAVVGESVGGALAAIRFNPDGSATGGRIALTDGARRGVVGVDWLTGRVSVVQSQ